MENLGENIKPSEPSENETFIDIPFEPSFKEKLLQEYKIDPVLLLTFQKYEELEELSEEVYKKIYLRLRTANINNGGNRKEVAWMNKIEMCSKCAHKS